MIKLLSRRPTARRMVFPYTTLFRSCSGVRRQRRGRCGRHGHGGWGRGRGRCAGAAGGRRGRRGSRRGRWGRRRRDRKSTRLNSSHVAISYAVFCLKKKKKKNKCRVG